MFPRYGRRQRLWVWRGALWSVFRQCCDIFCHVHIWFEWWRFLLVHTCVCANQTPWTFFWGFSEPSVEMIWVAPGCWFLRGQFVRLGDIIWTSTEIRRISVYSLCQRKHKLKFNGVLKLPNLWYCTNSQYVRAKFDCLRLHSSFDYLVKAVEKDRNQIRDYCGDFYQARKRLSF